MLNGLDEMKMSNKEHKISIHHLGSGTTEDMIDFIKPIAKRNPEDCDSSHWHKLFNKKN